ncbi:hypothetical protein D3C71_2111330 [compost metagenome]
MKPACPAATGTNSKPITATMAPMAAGGKTTSIQLVPAILTMSATTQKMTPTTIKAPSA